MRQTTQSWLSSEIGSKNIMRQISLKAAIEAKISETVCKTACEKSSSDTVRQTGGKQGVESRIVSHSHLAELGNFSNGEAGTGKADSLPEKEDDWIRASGIDLSANVWVF